LLPQAGGLSLHLAHRVTDRCCCFRTPSPHPAVLCMCMHAPECLPPTGPGHGLQSQDAAPSSTQEHQGCCLFLAWWTTQAWRHGPYTAGSAALQHRHNTHRRRAPFAKLCTLPDCYCPYHQYTRAVPLRHPTHELHCCQHIRQQLAVRIFSRVWVYGGG
jgi:hypothetical protein